MSETGGKGPEITQDIDLNGNDSNPDTRAVGREKLKDPTLSEEDKKFYENQTKCARGDEYKAFVNARKLKDKK